MKTKRRVLAVTMFHVERARESFGGPSLVDEAAARRGGGAWWRSGLFHVEREWSLASRD